MNRGKRVIQRAVGRSLVATAGAYIVDDRIKGVRQHFGTLSTPSGSTHSARSISESVAYIEGVFADYAEWGAIEHYYGTAAEVGPGDNAGVALLLRAAGCERVELIDRFRSYRDTQQQQRIYEELSRRHDLTRLQVGDDWAEDRLSGVEWHIGRSAESHFRDCAQRGGRYDFILSRAVLEHLYDPLGAIRAMAGALNTNGTMVHEVDLRDHGMFSMDHDALDFLRFSPRVHRQMTQHSGRPNRVMFDRYKQALEQLRTEGLVGHLLVSDLVGIGRLEPCRRWEHVPEALKEEARGHVAHQRAHFHRCFERTAIDDLCVSGFVFVARRP